MTKIVWEDHGDVVVLRLEGERLNAFSRATYAALQSELERFAGEECRRVLILTGAGRAFCSGQDLEDVGDLAALPREVLAERLHEVQELTRCMRASDKLLVAAINGPAVGFGAELTLACDVRFASEDAYFLFPELTCNLYFTNATLELLPALAGTSRACELLFGGSRWHATEALTAGFVSRVVPAEELLPVARGFATRAAAVSRDAMAATLRYLRGRQASGINNALRYEVDTFLELRANASPTNNIDPPV